MVSLQGENYGNTISWYDSPEAYIMFDKIKEQRDKYLKKCYLNEDASLKEIFQNEQTIRNMSLLGIVKSDLVMKVREHNEKISANLRNQEAEYLI